MNRYLGSLAVGLMLSGGVLAGPGAVEFPEPKPVWYGTLVDADFVGLYARTPIRKDVVVIDSRPDRKYDKGHIVPAINIPQRKFDQLTHLLPEGKSTLLIFYCGGLKCPLSHKSAFQAEKLGYTNIAVYPAGYPDWLKAIPLPISFKTHTEDSGGTEKINKNK